MPKNHIHKIYDHWIEKNRHRFNYKPVITKKSKQGYEFQFLGISSMIKGWINKSALSIVVDYQGEMIDFIFDMDVIVKQTETGFYFCEWCQSAYESGYTKEKPKQFLSKKELL